MSDSSAHSSAAGGLPPIIPARRPIPATDPRSAAAPGDGQQLRQLFLDQGRRIRDAKGGAKLARSTHAVTVTIDDEVYLAFQARCREYDLSVSKAVQLLMGGTELPAPRPVLVHLPAALDAEALRVLHDLGERVADCQADGTLDNREAVRIHDVIAKVSSTIGGQHGQRCPCAERARLRGTDADRREDA